MSSPRKPKLSVMVLTYNQAPYIAECLESIVRQELDVPFEVVIGDDVSNDGTSDIVDKYVKDYPSLVRHVRPAKNQGVTRNYYDTFAETRGEYVAFIDGDDRMLPGKLRHGIGVLDANADCVISSHQIRVFDSNTNQTLRLYSSASTPEKAGLEHLILHNCYFGHPSKMYRRSAAEAFPRRELFTVDFLLHVEQATRGLIHYSPKVLSEYRVHGAGITSNPLFKDEIVEGHVAGYLRAVELGLPREIANEGLRRFLIGQCIGRLKRHDFDGYRKLLRLMDVSGVPRTVSISLMHATRMYPQVASLGYRLKKKIDRIFNREGP